MATEPLWRGETEHYGAENESDLPHTTTVTAPPGTSVVILTEDDYEALVAIAEDAGAFFASLEEADDA